jgi:hypothetical protein
MIGKPFMKLHFLMFLIWTIKGLRKIKRLCEILSAEIPENLREKKLRNGLVR